MFIENIIDDNWEIIYKSNFIQKIIILSYKCSFKLKKKLSYIFSILITKAISYEVNDENWIYSGFELIIDTLSFFSNKKIHLILSNILESFDNYTCFCPPLIPTPRSPTVLSITLLLHLYVSSPLGMNRVKSSMCI